MKYLLVLCLLIAAAGSLRAQCSCEPIGDLENGTTVIVATVAELRNAIAGASGPTAILLQDGEYVIESGMEIAKPGIIIRSAGRNRENVVLSGGGSSVPDWAFLVTEGDFTLADLTIRGFVRHGMLVRPAGGTGNVHVRNVAFIDAGEQYLRATGTDAAAIADLVVECSYFQRTPGSATLVDGAGVIIEKGDNATIVDSRFTNIAGVQGSAAAVVAMKGCRNVIVERNMIANCDRGIVIGDTMAGETDVQGAIIRTNMIAGGDEGGPGIAVANTSGAAITHNTVYSPGGAGWSIGLRYAPTIGAVLSDNFTDEPILARDGAQEGERAGNIATAAAGDFVDAAGGDLHIVATSIARDRGVNPAHPDIDCQDVQDGQADVGADEYSTTSGVGAARRLSGYQIAYEAGRDAIMVTLDDPHDIRLELYDMLGERLGAVRGSGDAMIITAGLPAGIYLLLIDAGAEGRSVEKMVLGR